MRRRLVSVLLALVLVPLAAGQALAADTLTVTGLSILPTEGQTFTGAVATFTDSNTGTSSSAFLAQIDWGDGSTSPSTGITGSAGSFSVAGSHTYAEEGTHTISIIVGDMTVGGAPNARGSGSATVAEGDVLSAPTLATIAALEGTAFSGTVATFTDSYTSNVASDFTATIGWGDGTTSSGTVIASSGIVSVSGIHTYADEGSYDASVKLKDDTPGTATATASGTVTVAEGDVLAPGHAAGFSGQQEGTPTAASLLFTDTYAGNVASDFTGTINWGDGTTTAGTITAGSPGSYIVNGTHTYADEGSYPISATLTDDAPGTATATAGPFSVSITEADVLTPTGGYSPTNLYYQTPFSGIVGLFADSDTNNVPSDFTATINWGDGTTTPGTVTGGAGNLSVSGGHTYAAVGTHNKTVTLTDDAPGTATATLSGPMIVGKAPTTTAISVIPSTVTYGQEAFTVTATVSPVAPGGGTPTGTVTVTIGAATLCSDVTLSAGIASCTVSAGTLNVTPFLPDTVTDTYSGDTNFLGSSGTATLTVLPPYHPPLPPTGLVLTVDVGKAKVGPFASSVTAPLGSTAWYQLNLQNTSAVAISGVNLVDSATPGGLPASCPAVPGSFAAGATYTCTFSAPVAAGITTNTASATAGGAYLTASATVTAAGAAPVLTDGIAPGLDRGTSGFGTGSVSLAKPGYVTYLVQLDPSFAGQAVTIWTRTRAGAWTAVTTRLVGADGTVHYYLRINAWTGFWAMLDGAASHGRIGTVR